MDMPVYSYDSLIESHQARYEQAGIPAALAIDIAVASVNHLLTVSPEIIAAKQSADAPAEGGDELEINGETWVILTPDIAPSKEDIALFHKPFIIEVSSLEPAYTMWSHYVFPHGGLARGSAP